MYAAGRAAGAGADRHRVRGCVGLVQQGDKTIEVRKEILIEQRERLVARMNEMQKTLDLLNHKIEVYENAVLKQEKQLIPIEE